MCHWLTVPRTLLAEAAHAQQEATDGKHRRSSLQIPIAQIAGILGVVKETAARTLADRGASATAAGHLPDSAVQWSSFRRLVSFSLFSAQ